MTHYLHSNAASKRKVPIEKPTYQRPYRSGYGSDLNEQTFNRSYAPGYTDPRSGEKRIIKIARTAILLTVIVILIYIFLLGKPSSTIKTNTTDLREISACTIIIRPGSYYLDSNVISSGSGPCIYVTSGNVSVNGNGYFLIGNRTNSLKNTVSYGIEVTQPYANISKLNIVGFSYGVYLNGSGWSRISNVTVNGTMISGISLYDSSYNLLYGDHVIGNLGKSGGINITGGRNNSLYMDSARYGSYYGLLLSGTVGNNITKSTMDNNPADMICFSEAGFSSSNKFDSSSCKINKFCNFAHCSQINDQYFVNRLRLAPGISSCGSINAPGSYQLESDLNLADYMNVSAYGLSGLSCIQVNAPNVDLQCNGHTISNAQYGLFSGTGQYNVTVSGCRFLNDTYGVYLQGVIGFKLDSIIAQGGKYGVYLFGSEGINLTNSSATGNLYGVYANGTTYSTIYNFNASNNAYGIMFDNSSKVSLNSGIALANSRADLYCTTNTYNSTRIYAAGIKCTSTDCNWAGAFCSRKILPTLKYYPLNGCGAITAPGDYSIQGNVTATGSCFDISASNVRINCAPGSLISSTTNIGDAFNVHNVSNVTINRCSISEFHNGIVATNTRFMTLNSLTIHFVSDGILVNNGGSDLIRNDTVTRFADQAYSLIGLNGSEMLNDTANLGLLGYGFNFSNSFGNKIVNNIANLTNYGFYIAHSLNNTIYNNYVYSQQGLGYYCTPDSAGVYNQYGRINYGVSNVNCNWLVEVSPIFAPNICTLITTPDTVSITHDMIYSSGGICFSVSSGADSKASGTTINCNGNTVFATNGGTFLYSYNTSGVVLENCVLIGFTNTAVFTSKKLISGISVTNNTFASTSNSSIYVREAQLSKVYDNQIMNSSRGIVLYGFNNSIAHNNSIDKTGTGLILNWSAEANIMNNTISNSSLGVLIDNSQFTTVFKNRIHDSTTGFSCAGSGELPNNIDLGGNICSGVKGCNWITSPACR